MGEYRRVENEVVLPDVAAGHGGVFRIAHSPASSSGASLLTDSAFILKGTWPLLIFSLYFVPQIIGKARTDSTLLLWGLIGVSLVVFLCASYMAFLFLYLRRDFILRQNGIKLPFIYFLAARGRLSWSWMDINSVIFSRSDAEVDSADQFVLRFLRPNQKKPVEIHIKLREVEQVDLKKMIYAIVTNAPHAVFDPPLEKVALEIPTVSGIKHLNFQSFTSMWDEEYSARYAPTLFVPMAPGAELRSGRIKITELVTCGGSAAIYSATNPYGVQIIVKEAVIPKNSSDVLKQKAIELFNREAMLLSKLNHPNIAKVIDHFVENEHHYEVIEYIDGLDLRRFVKERGPQPTDFVLNWIQQICEILVYLHTQKPPVIHRDLTPDNLVLRVDGQLVLIDFGAANVFLGTATGTMVGKQSYMSPEQLRGKAVPQSDIFSLGCTCFYLLTGRDPTPLEVSRVDESKDGAVLNAFLAKCTAIEASERFDSATEVLDEILRIRKSRTSE